MHCLCSEFWIGRTTACQCQKLGDAMVQGDLTDPLYFDFISYAQFATMTQEMQRGKQVFQVGSAPGPPAPEAHKGCRLRCSGQSLSWAFIKDQKSLPLHQMHVVNLLNTKPVHHHQVASVWACLKSKAWKHACRPCTHLQTRLRHSCCLQASCC